METFARLPKSLQAILQGDVPDTEWELRPTPRLHKSLDLAIGQWRFIGSFFRRASQDVRCRVPLLPVLHWLALVGGQVPSLPMFVDIVSSSPLASGNMEARCYSAYTGGLRELSAGLEITTLGYRVFKNPRLDLENGTDWIVRRELKVQVSHAGRGSRRHWNERKADKTADDVVILTAAPCFDGLALVDPEQIEAKLIGVA